MTDPQPLLSELRRLIDLPAPSGFEEPVLRAARDALSPACSRVEVDLRGNVYGWQPGSDPAAPTVMVTAHADEIGFLITAILPSGFLRFTRLGHPTELVLPGQPVHVLTPAGPRNGVIGVKPGHVLSGDAARTVPQAHDLYIDVGAESADQAASWGIEPGTPAVFAGSLQPTHNPHRFFGRAVDNRMGVAAVLHVARTLSRESLPATRVYAIVVEEEIGLRGAEVAARHLQPDIVLALDTVPAGGTPDLRPDELPWNIGAGPLVKVRETRGGLSTHRPLRELVRRVAHEHGIPYQIIVDTAGITDATSAQQASASIAALTLGLPRRYSHSAVELFDARDLTHLADLTTHTLRALHSLAPLHRLP